MAVALPMIALGVMAAGTAYSVASNVQAAKTQAQLADLEAKSMAQQAEFQEQQFRRQAELALGGARADIAASGVSASSGTPLFQLLESAKQAELEAQSIRRTGTLGVQGKLFEGRLARRSIPNYYVQGATQGASLFTTFASRKF